MQGTAQDTYEQRHAPRCALQHMCNIICNQQCHTSVMILLAEVCGFADENEEGKSYAWSYPMRCKSQRALQCRSKTYACVALLPKLRLRLKSVPVGCIPAAHPDSESETACAMTGTLCRCVIPVQVTHRSLPASLLDAHRGLQRHSLRLHGLWLRSLRRDCTVGSSRCNVSHSTAADASSHPSTQHCRSSSLQHRYGWYTQTQCSAFVKVVQSPFAETCWSLLFQKMGIHDCSCNAACLMQSDYPLAVRIV